MKKAFLFVVLAALAVGSAVAQEEENFGPMTEAAGTEASSGLATIEIYPLADGTKNQTWVRKYEGQRDIVGSLGTVNLLGYNRPWQYWVEGADVLSGNTVLGTEFGYADNLWMRAYTLGVTRRIPVFPLVNAVTGETLIGASLPGDLRVDRATNAADVWLTPWHSDGVAVFGSFWGHNENGNRPLLFRSRSGSAVVGGVTYPNRTKFETTEPVDQDTFNVGAGLVTKLGPALVSYSGYSFDYSNNVSGPSGLAGFAASEPLRKSRFQDTTARTQSIKTSVPLGDRLALTGNWTGRSINHKVKGVVVPEGTTVGGFTVPDNTHNDLTSSLVSLRFIAMPDLQFNARYHYLNNDRKSVFVPTSTTGLPVNDSISRKEKEGELTATYTGFKSTIITGGFNGRRVNREITGSELTEDFAEDELPIINPETETKTWNVRARSYILPDITLRADWKTSDIDGPAYHGMPSASDTLNAGISWSPDDSLSLYADYRRLKEDNNNAPTPTFLTVGEDTEAYEELREEWSGAKYYNKSDSIILGLYKSLGTRMTLDANYMRDNNNSRAYWILGEDPAFPPHPGGAGDTTGLPPELVPYDAKDTMYGAGLTYAATSKLTLRGNLLSGRTRGVTSTSSLFRLVPPAGDKPREWQPIKVNYWKSSIGLTYRATEAQQVWLQLEHNTFTDEIETMFDGRYTLVSVGVTTQF